MRKLECCQTLTTHKYTFMVVEFGWNSLTRLHLVSEHSPLLWLNTLALYCDSLTFRLRVEPTGIPDMSVTMNLGGFIVNTQFYDIMHHICSHKRTYLAVG